MKNKLQKPSGGDSAYQVLAFLATARNSGQVSSWRNQSMAGRLCKTNGRSRRRLSPPHIPLQGRRDSAAHRLSQASQPDAVVEKATIQSTYKSMDSGI